MSWISIKFSNRLKCTLSHPIYRLSATCRSSIHYCYHHHYDYFHCAKSNKNKHKKKNLPFEQYSVRISTVGRGKSMHAPTKRTVFSWLTSRACFISHNNVDVISTYEIKYHMINKHIHVYISNMLWGMNEDQKWKGAENIWKLNFNLMTFDSRL